MNLDTVSTEMRLQQLAGKEAILQTWETMTDQEIQDREHEYLLGLKKRIRTVRNYLLFRGRDRKATEL